MQTPLGETLTQRVERWAVEYDVATGIWKITDLWDPSLGALSLEDSIPLNSSAVKIIAEDAARKLFLEADRLGILFKYGIQSFGNKEIEKKEKKPKDKIKLEVEGQYSESFLLKNRVIKALERIVISDELMEIENATAD